METGEISGRLDTLNVWLKDVKNLLADILFTREVRPNDWSSMAISLPDSGEPVQVVGQNLGRRSMTLRADGGEVWIAPRKYDGATMRGDNGSGSIPDGSSVELLHTRTVWACTDVAGVVLHVIQENDLGQGQESIY